jgi:hypothetical protein
MKKDYYLWFLIIFILVCSCIVSYRSGYDAGFTKGQTMCHIIIPEEK